MREIEREIATSGKTIEYFGLFGIWTIPMDISMQIELELLIWA